MPDVKRILVLDDYADLLAIMEEVLVYEKFEVKGIAESAKIIAIAESYHPDLIIIDCHLSGDDSASLCKAVKAHPILHQIPVVICSAYVHCEDTIKKFGCEAVISKPYNMKDLLETVNLLLVA